MNIYKNFATGYASFTVTRNNGSDAITKLDSDITKLKDCIAVEEPIYCNSIIDYCGNDYETLAAQRLNKPQERLKVYLSSQVAKPRDLVRKDYDIVRAPDKADVIVLPKEFNVVSNEYFPCMAHLTLLHKASGEVEDRFYTVCVSCKDIKGSNIWNASDWGSLFIDNNIDEIEQRLRRHQITTDYEFKSITFSQAARITVVKYWLWIL